MTIFTVVNGPAGEGEVSGNPIFVNDGDTYIFAADFSGPAFFTVQSLAPTSISIIFDKSSTAPEGETITASVSNMITPTVIVEDGVDVGLANFSAAGSPGMTLLIGDDAAFGKITLSNGPSTLTAGDNVTVESIDGRNGQNEITFGDNWHVEREISLARGDDSLTLGETALDRAGVIAGGEGNDSLTMTLSDADRASFEAQALKAGWTKNEDGSFATNGATLNWTRGSDVSTIQEFESVTVCFTRGTLIDTDAGPVPIEELSAGDMVRTADDGAQPIRWIGSTVRPAQGNLAPILIRKGALGNDRDLKVSPQHRMLLSGWQATLLFGEEEVLATAKSLVNDKTIVRVEGGEVEYFHILFDRHQIIFAEGCASESFHPGTEGWKALDAETRLEIETLFPQLSSNADAGGPASYGPAARPSLSSREARALASYMAP